MEKVKPMSKSLVDLVFGPEWKALRELEHKTQRLSLVSAHRRAQTARRVQELERDLARVALVVRAIADLCIARGLFTAEQLRSQFDHADFADGVFDQALDPKLVAPGATRAGRLPLPKPRVAKAAALKAPPAKAAAPKRAKRAR